MCTPNPILIHIHNSIKFKLPLRLIDTMPPRPISADTILHRVITCTWPDESRAPSIKNPSDDIG